MTDRWSEADLAEVRKRLGARPSGRAGPPPPPPRAAAAPKGASKYGAIKTKGPDGAGGLRTYDSKAGAELAESLERQKRAGEISAYFVEVSIPLGADENDRQVRYRADALKVIETYPDGSFRGRFLEKKCRGYDTPNSRTKRAALRGRGLNIEVV